LKIPKKIPIPYLSLSTITTTTTHLPPTFLDQHHRRSTQDDYSPTSASSSLRLPSFPVIKEPIDALSRSQVEVFFVSTVARFAHGIFARTSLVQATCTYCLSISTQQQTSQPTSVLPAAFGIAAVVAINFLFTKEKFAEKKRKKKQVF